MPGVIDFLEDEGGASSSIDITSSLLGGRSSRQAGKSRQEDEEDDDAAFISAALNKQNKRAGTEMVKKTAGKSKGKNKVTSGTMSGGGSFQSMGECQRCEAGIPV